MGRSEVVDGLIKEYDLVKTRFSGVHLWGVSRDRVLWYFTLRMNPDRTWWAIPQSEAEGPPSFSPPISWIQDPSIPETNPTWRNQVRQHMKIIEAGALVTLKNGGVALITKKDPPRRAVGPDGAFRIGREDIESLYYDDWMPVTSSNLEAVRYRGTYAKGHLDVKFKNGTVYRYSDVPVDIVVPLLNAKSIGSAFNQLIKKSGFAYEKIT